MMDVPHYYKINEILLTCIGQWPLQTRLKSRCIVATIIFLSASNIGPQIAAAIKFRDQPDVVLECFSLFILCIVCFTKLLTCMVNSKKMLKMLNLIVEDWKMWAPDKEIAVLHEYAKIGRKMTIAYAVGVYFSTFTFVLQATVPKIIDNLLYNGTKPGEFPFPCYYYHLDVQRYYFYMTGFMSVCSAAILLNVIACDTMLIAYVQHNCGIFAALGRKLRRLGENTLTRDGEDADLDTLATCIVRHNRAIEFSTLIESIYSANFFIVIGLNTIIMSLTGLQIITKMNAPEKTIRYIVFINIQMVHLFVECYISQNLLDHSANLRECIYDGKWYKTSLNCQKLLRLMILRCSRPCKLTAGKMCEISLETFLTVVKTSMSYFTLLRSVQ